jgi:hypothetical protein
MSYLNGRVLSEWTLMLAYFSGMRLLTETAFPKDVWSRWDRRMSKIFPHPGALQRGPWRAGRASNIAE